MFEYSSLGDYLDKDKRVSDFTVEGKCSGCGSCCSNILYLSKSEILRIKNFVRDNNIKPVNRAPLLLKEPVLDMVCPFRGKDSCLIYEVRPDLCRNFICSNPSICNNFSIVNFPKLKRVNMREEFF